MDPVSMIPFIMAGNQKGPGPEIPNWVIWIICIITVGLLFLATK